MVEYIVNENDAVGAFILSYCNQSLISEITSRLTKDKLLSVVSNLVHVRKPSSDLLNQFEYVLKDRLLVGKNKVPPKMNVPLHTATSVFETLPNDVRMTIFSSLEQQSPELVQTIQSEIFTFEDIAILSNADIQIMVFELKDMDVLSKALMGSSKALVSKFKITCRIDF